MAISAATTSERSSPAAHKAAGAKGVPEALESMRPGVFHHAPSCSTSAESIGFHPTYRVLRERALSQEKLQKASTRNW